MSKQIKKRDSVAPLKHQKSNEYQPYDHFPDVGKMIQPQGSLANETV